MKLFTRLATFVGSAVMGAAAWKLIYPLFVQRGPSNFVLPLSRDGHPAPVAVITGASAGIGQAFAERLARYGYDLVAVARRKERLDELAARLSRQYAVVVQPVVADLANPGDVEHLAGIVSELGKADRLELLINNAGFGTVGQFAELPLQSQLDMLGVHDKATLSLTHAALPGMIRRGRGGVINVASTAGWFPLPGNATYSASKRFLITFSQALQSELDGSGVYVQALCPGFTYTEFHDREAFRTAGFQRSQIPEFMWQTSDQVVEASLNALGREVICIPGIVNRAITLAQAAVPRSLMRHIRDAMFDAQR